MTRELGPLLAHPSFQASDEGSAAIFPGGKTFLCAEAIDIALDGKQGVDALHRLQCQWQD